MALSGRDKRQAKIAALRSITHAMGRESMRDAISRKRAGSEEPPDDMLGKKREVELPEDELDVYRGEGVPRGEMRHEDAEEMEGDDPDLLAEDIQEDADKIRRLARSKRRS
jgi:transcriptional regulator of met regulon